MTVNHQRKVVYDERSTVLFGDDISAKITGMIERVVADTFDACFTGEDPSEYRPEEFSTAMRGLLTEGKTLSYTEDELRELDLAALKQEFIDKALKIYKDKDTLFASVPGMPENAMREIEKMILLRNVDSKWMDHLEVMDELKGYVGLNSYAQRDPVAIYRIESAEMFDRMATDIREDTVRQVLAVVPKLQSTERVQVAKETGIGPSGPVRRTVINKTKTVSRNDFCPCGSGKKYKHCCWAKDQSGGSN